MPDKSTTPGKTPQKEGGKNPSNTDRSNPKPVTPATDIPNTKRK